jgi:eukaryotic-like serine/threonine-protein kinase
MQDHHAALRLPVRPRAAVGRRRPIPGVCAPPVPHVVVPLPRPALPAARRAAALKKESVMSRTFTARVSHTVMLAAALLLLASPAGAQGAKPLKKCPVDAVAAGTVCMDMYEASVWRVPDPAGTNKKLVKKIQQGKVKLTDLTAGGATQLGVAGDDYAPCEDSGQNCADDIYAVSLAGVTPARLLTWFQAQEACANARKRLPTSAEWQVGANGTPDPGGDDGTTDCNTTTSTFNLPEDPVPTGSRSACVSARGAFDMAGNVSEWVADWVPASPECPGWDGFSNDYMCLSGASTTETGPGALLRGGAFTFGPEAGPLSVGGGIRPSRADGTVGFRCAR